MRIDERKLVVVSGPSGCGKDTIVRALRAKRQDLAISISCTTRPPREGEQNGVNYYYISHNEFLERLMAGRMLEFNEYAGNLYGTPRDELEQMLAAGRTVVLIIDVHGARNVKSIYPGAMLVFLTPPSLEALRERIHRRGREGDEEIAERLRIAEAELKEIEFYDRCIVNDDVERCAAELSAAIDAWQYKQAGNEGEKKDAEA